LSGIATIYQNLKGDKVIWLIVALLSLASLLAVYSATGSMAYRMRGGDNEYYLFQQAFFLMAGMGAMYAAYKLHYMQYSKLAPALLLLAVAALMWTLGFGTEINEAKRWITLPWIDKTIQTSDFAKPVLIIWVARALAVKQDYIKDFKQAFLPIIAPVIIVCLLIAPEDLSTAVLLFVTCMLMMIIGRISLRYVLLLIFLGIMALSVLVMIGSIFPDLVRLDTWMSRINEFIYNTDGGYQLQQSKIAIASGELTGVGPGNSMQRNFLPFAYADFIYAIIVEEYGLIGGFTILGLYSWLLFRCTRIVTRCPKTFGAILAMGLCLNIVIQAFANIAVSVQLVPATGLTLPLVSMGGTSILFTCISLGIILSVSRYVEEAQFKQAAIEKMEDASTN